MKTLTKIEYVRRWLGSGKTLTPGQAVINWNYMRLASGINRLRERGMWIINIGKPGKFAKYIMIENGPINNLLIKGHRIAIIDAHYINGYADMNILVNAYNGVKSKVFWCNADAFRDKKIMIKHLEDGI